MKLTKKQLKNLVQEVILEESTGLVNEDQLLEEGFADLVRKMKTSARSGLRSFGRIAKNSKVSRELERVLDTTENATPEEKDAALTKVMYTVKPTFKQMIDVFSEYEMKVSQAAEKMNSKLKQAAIDPSLLQRLGDMLSVEDENVEKTGPPEGMEDETGTVMTGPPEGMEDEEGNRVSEAEEETWGNEDAGVSYDAAPAVYRAAAELTNWVVSHESYLSTLTDIAGTSGQGGAFKELLNAISGQEPKMDKGVAMSVSDDPEQPVGLQKDRKPRKGVEKARATPVPKTRTLGSNLEETITLSEKKLNSLIKNIKNELKNSK